MYVLEIPGYLCLPPREGPSGLGLHNSIRATDHDPTLGHICPIPMPAGILSAGINDVTPQAICCECNANKLEILRSSAYNNARIPLAREPSMLCPACSSRSKASSKMAYNVGDNGSPCATPRSMGKKSDFCPLTITRLLFPRYKFLRMRHNLPLTPMSQRLCSSPSLHTVSKALAASLKNSHVGRPCLVRSCRMWDKLYT